MSNVSMMGNLQYLIKFINDLAVNCGLITRISIYDYAIAVFRKHDEIDDCCCVVRCYPQNIEVIGFVQETIRYENENLVENIVKCLNRIFIAISICELFAPSYDVFNPPDIMHGRKTRFHGILFNGNNIAAVVFKEEQMVLSKLFYDESISIKYGDVTREEIYEFLSYHKL